MVVFYDSVAYLTIIAFYKKDSTTNYILQIFIQSKKYKKRHVGLLRYISNERHRKGIANKHHYYKALLLQIITLLPLAGCRSNTTLKCYSNSNKSTRHDIHVLYEYYIIHATTTIIPHTSN